MGAVVGPYPPWLVSCRREMDRSKFDIPKTKNLKISDLCRGRIHIPIGRSVGPYPPLAPERPYGWVAYPDRRQWPPAGRAGAWSIPLLISNQYVVVFGLTVTAG